MSILIIDFLVCLFIWFAIRIWFKIDKLLTFMIILVYFFALSPYFHIFLGTVDTDVEHIEEWDDDDWDEDDSDFLDEISISNFRHILLRNYVFLRQKWV